MRYKILGFKWYARRIARWQAFYRLIGKRPRTPQHFIPPTLAFSEQKNARETRFSINKMKQLFILLIGNNFGTERYN